MKTKIFLFCGRSGSGKTSISQAVGNRTELQVVTYNAILAQLVKDKGFTSKGEYIFNTPFEVFSRDYDEYAINWINNKVMMNDVIIVEGLCSAVGFNCLKKQYGTAMTTFFIEVEESVRMQRIKERDGKVFLKKEEYKENYGVGEICKLADYVLDGKLPLSKNINCALKIIRGDGVIGRMV